MKSRVGPPGRSGVVKSPDSKSMTRETSNVVEKATEPYQFLSYTTRSNVPAIWDFGLETRTIPDFLQVP